MTKFELPKTKDLRLVMFKFDFECSYANHTSSNTTLFVYGSSAIDIMPELKRNILNFGYGVNFKYEGMLSHSFD